MRVGIVHDYITQRGGAERVVLDLAAAFPGTPIHTSLYDLEGTFPEFAALEIVPSALNRIGALRHHHRLALPVLAPVFSHMSVDADVVVCSSSGWAHGVASSGRKVVYCHTPARWLYQTDRYLGSGRTWASLAMRGATGPLRRWDQAAARSADRYLVNSSEVRRRVEHLYGISAEILHPPPGFSLEGPSEALASVTPGFVLCVSRLLEYKNVRPLVEAFRSLGDKRLVLAGGGPLLGTLRQSAPRNVELVGRVSDAQLRWLYSTCVGVVAPSYEDFGLVPLEAAMFAKPTAALSFGGYLDTIVEEQTGTFFASPSADDIAAAVVRLVGRSWVNSDLVEHAERFSRRRFIERIQAVVADECR